MSSANRQTSGQSFAELAMGLLVAIPLFLVLIDCALCAIAVMVNDNCARDAARAAAGGVPQDFNSAPDPTTGEIKTIAADSLKRAQTTVNNAKSTGGYIAGPVILGTGELNNPDTGPQPAADGAAFTSPDPQVGGPWIGNYRVTTEIKVNLPAYIPGLTAKEVVFHSRQEFPIVRTEQPFSN